MKRTISVLSIMLLAGGILFLASCRKETQKTTEAGKASQDTLAAYRKAWADSAKAALIHAWNGYKKYAWGHDELRPISKGYRDWYSHSLYMTPLDAFDTMTLMHLDKQAAEAKKLVLDSLSFDHDMYVKNFEITIRMLGSLLSAYQLDHDKRFLDLAEDLGNRLLPVFDSPTGMPYQNVNLKTGKTRGAVTNPAEVGTLTLEFGTLSKLSDNPVYYNKAKKAVIELYNRSSDIGLVGSSINVETGKWLSQDCNVGGGIDSYYEYLLKAYKLFGDHDFKNMYDHSIAAVNKYLADSVSTGFWYGHVNMDTGKRIAPYFGALDAFFPAVLALGGDLHRAEMLDSSCYKMWMVAGIEPEQINYVTMKITSPNYELRPENLESAYYLYHYTHNPEYLKRGQAMFESILKYCRTDAGFAALSNVKTKQKKDSMESFLFAEVFKYSYLLFAPDSTLDFNNVIFNTEAHPLERTW